MEDAVDKPVQRRSRRQEPSDSPQAVSARSVAHQIKDRAANNPIIETFWELNGTKLRLCKRKKSGSIYRSFEGSTVPVDKTAEAASMAQKVREKCEQLKKEGKLRHSI